jgi:uncharacterized protein (TIGR03067 family)
MPEPEARPTVPHDDIENLLDGELSRLPDKYRAAIVLCDLEGHTRKEAALHLGVPEGTVAARLTRARAMLAKRLLRRGFVQPRLVVALFPPAAVVSGTIHGATAGVISPTVATLMQGALNAMLWRKLQTVTAVLLVVAMLGLGGGLLARHTAAPRSAAVKAPAKGGPEARKKLAEAIKQERKRFAGTWQLVGLEVQGRKASRKVIDEEFVRPKIIHYAQNLGMKIPRTQGVNIVVVYDAEGKWKEQTDRAPILTFSEGTSSINPAGKPRTIDQVVTRRVGGKGYTRRGIYEFVNSDTLRVCFAEPGKPRPAGFSTKPDDGCSLLVFARVEKGK